MDSSGSQESPGEADEVSGCKSERDSPMPSQETGDLDWPAASSSHLEQVRVALHANQLLYLIYFLVILFF